jgi:hypothetical protein
MNTLDPSSLLALGFCLVILAVVTGVLVVLLNRGRASRRPRDGVAVTPSMRDVPTPERRPGEGPLWNQGPASDDDLVEDEPAPAVDLPYTRRRYLLTQAEREFFAVLQAAAPDGWYVFPQVRLANLVMLRKGTRNWKPHFSRMAQKCVDFVLCDEAEIGPRLVVELDDSSHDRPERQARDAFVDAALAAAGLPILHVRWQRRYDAALLATQIRAAVGLTPLQQQTPAVAAAPARATVPHSVAASTVSAPVVATGPRWACRSCRAEVSATAKFCPTCGALLEL